jgi:glutamate transport system substrate-binding protein
MTWLHVPPSPTHFTAVDRVSNRGDLLLHGPVDLIIIANYSITDGRKRQGISFSAPYLMSYQGILTRSADGHAIRSVKDLRGLKVCTGPADTTPYQHLMRVNQDDHLNVIISTENDSAGCVTDLLGNRVDAVVGDDTILIGFQRQKPHMLTLAHVILWRNPEQYGIGFIAKTPADAAVFNAAIHQMIRDGSWKKAIVDNFCPGAADLASPCSDAKLFLDSPPPAR